MRFPEQSPRHIGRGFHIAAAQKYGNVGVRIKRALRQSAGNARNRAQALNHVIAQFNVFAPHLFNTLLRPRAYPSLQPVMA